MPNLLSPPPCATQNTTLSKGTVSVSYVDHDGGPTPTYMLVTAATNTTDGGSVDPWAPSFVALAFSAAPAGSTEPWCTLGQIVPGLQYRLTGLLAAGGVLQVRVLAGCLIGHTGVWGASDGFSLWIWGRVAGSAWRGWLGSSCITMARTPLAGCRLCKVGDQQAPVPGGGEPLKPWLPPHPLLSIRCTPRRALLAIDAALRPRCIFTPATQFMQPVMACAAPAPATVPPRAHAGPYLRAHRRHPARPAHPGRGP